MNLDHIPDFIMTFNFFVLVVNILILIFAKKIIFSLDTSDLEGKEQDKNYDVNNKKKVKFLNFINIIIFITYPITFYTQIEFLNNFITVLFVIMIFFIANAWFIRRVVIFYGQEIEIGGHTYWKKGYKTNMFSLLITIFMFILGILVCLQVLHLNTLFQTGGAIAGILAFIGFTAPVWAPDMVASITILHNNRVQVGNIVKIRERKKLAWIRSISLTEIKLIDLVYGHPILIRPSKFRDLEIENLSMGVSGKRKDILQLMKIKVDYGVTIEEVEKVCLGAFDEMISDIDSKIERKFFSDKIYREVEILDFGDHAVLYKFGYRLSTPFYIPQANDLLNRYLQKYQNKYNVSFSTPYLIKN